MAHDDDGEERESTSATDSMEFVVRTAKRYGLKALLLLFSHSGGGKTYSALRIARGLVGPTGRIGVLDTEHNRALHYGDEFEFEHASMSAPFSPARYLKALREFEKQGIDCMIVDSMSHVQEGEGGLIDMAAEEERKAGGKSGMGSQWAKPKAEWKKVRNAFLQSKMHIIFCARAKNPLEKGEGKQLVKGDLVPIMPASFEYEVTVSVGIDVDTHTLIPVKIPNQLSGAFPLDQYMSESTGQMLRQWLDGEKIVDAAFEALKEVGREQAAKGVEPLKAWFTSLDSKNRARLKDYLDDELKPLAAGKAPRQPAAASGADTSRSETPARSEKKSAPPPTPPQADTRGSKNLTVDRYDQSGGPIPDKQEAKAPPPKKDPPPKQPQPPAADDGDPGYGGDNLDLDLDVDDGEDPATGRKAEPAAEEEDEGELPQHDYPPIRVGKDPNWSDIGGEIADYIEGQPGDVDLIVRVYKDVIAKMRADKDPKAARTIRMLDAVIAKAKT